MWKEKNFLMYNRSGFVIILYTGASNNIANNLQLEILRKRCWISEMHSHGERKNYLKIKYSFHILIIASRLSCRKL